MYDDENIIMLILKSGSMKLPGKFFSLMQKIPLQMNEISSILVLCQHWCKNLLR